METTWLIWMIMAILGLSEALYSLQGGMSWAREVRQAKESTPLASAPPLAVIVPCAGIDPGLIQNLEAYCRLSYPRYRLIFVTRDASDPAAEKIRSVLETHPLTDSQLVFAGAAQDRGQKVHNLLRGVRELSEAEILVFGDSDIRPQPDWLAGLVMGLDSRDVGAHTGFRWYLPPTNALASRLRSAWNAGIAGLLSTRNSPFVWGGAMAITRSCFEECGVAGYWEHSLSDDLSLTRAVKDRGLKIRFRPRALSFSHEDCRFKEFWNWSFRQMAITRVYSPGMWRLAWVAQILNSLTVWGGMALMVCFLTGWLSSIQAMTAVLLAGGVFLLGACKAELRWKAVAHLFPQHRDILYRDRWAYRLLGPVNSLFTLAALFRSALRREIEWRGIRYRMVSPVETEIVD